MSCPYCRSRKVAGERTVHVYDVRDETIAVNQVKCGKCGAVYSKTIRENPYDGKRRITINKSGAPPQVCANGRLERLKGRIRRKRVVSRNELEDGTERTYRIDMEVYCRPEHMRALRDELDELCTTCVLEGNFDVYDGDGNVVPYGRE